MTLVELATAAGEFAQTIADLSASHEGLGPQLAGALAGLANVERKVQELQDKQSNEDTLTIMATGTFPRTKLPCTKLIVMIILADEYARLINSVRVSIWLARYQYGAEYCEQLAFSSRVRIYHAWQNADGNVKRVKQQHETNRAQGRLAPDQLSRSLASVAEVCHIAVL